MSGKKKTKTPEEKLKDIESKISEAPQKSTYMDNEDDQESLSDWESSLEDFWPILTRDFSLQLK